MHGSPTTPRSVVLAALVADRAGFDAAIGPLDEPVLVFDAKTLRFLAANPAALRLYGWNEDELLCMTLFDIRSEDEARILREMVDHRAYDLFRDRIWHHLRADGRVLDVRVTSAPLVFDGRDARLQVVEPTDRGASTRWSTLPTTSVDPLTGLPDRSGFLDHLRRMLAPSTRPGALSHAVAVLGIDGFRSVNATAGAAVGDAVLAAVAARMGSIGPEVRLVARIAGDQFALLVETCPEDCPDLLGRRLTEAIRAPFGDLGRAIFLTASIGVAVVDDDASAERLLIDATEAMHQAKSEGRDRVVVHRHDDRLAVAERSTLVLDLPLALLRNEFVLHYQPVVDVAGVLVGAEALIRWQHPERGLLPPGSFIPLAEESAFMRALGRWVFLEAAAAARRFADAGVTVPIAVNVSSRQFGPDLVQEVRLAMSSAGIPASLLVIEITESMLADPALAERTVDELRSLGVSVWIDDFGTGFSCLGNLVHLHVNGLKLDRSFVAAVREPAGSAVVSAVTSLAHGLGLEVIAEGVETGEQRSEVVALGADLIQGYLVSPPVPEAAFAAYVQGASR